jgi:hypothetical protein
VFERKSNKASTKKSAASMKKEQQPPKARETPQRTPKTTSKSTTATTINTTSTRASASVKSIPNQFEVSITPVSAPIVEEDYPMPSVDVDNTFDYHAAATPMVDVDVDVSRVETSFRSVTSHQRTTTAKMRSDDSISTGSNISNKRKFAEVDKENIEVQSRVTQSTLKQTPVVPAAKVC